jgi:hypothetical protein
VTATWPAVRCHALLCDDLDRVLEVRNREGSQWIFPESIGLASPLRDVAAGALAAELAVDLQAVRLLPDPIGEPINVCLAADETAFDLYFVFMRPPAGVFAIAPKAASRWAPFDTLSDARLAAGLMSWAGAKPEHREEAEKGAEGEHLG